MMPPALLVAWIGPVPVPIPLFLLWPIVFLVWLAVWIAAWVSGRPSPHRVPWLERVLVVLRLMGALRGLVVNLNAHDGPRIALRFF